MTTRRPFERRTRVAVHEIEPEVEIGDILAGAQFADAYSVSVGDAVSDARSAAERMFGRSPRWLGALMALRNLLVRPFGLATDVSKIADSSRRIGFFPVVNESRERLVLGFDDKHLDFRVVVDLSASDEERRVTGATLVRTHNLLGRTYLAVVLPFHRVILKSMLRQAAESADAPPQVTPRATEDRR